MDLSALTAALSSQGFSKIKCCKLPDDVVCLVTCPGRQAEAMIFVDDTKPGALGQLQRLLTEKLMISLPADLAT